MTEAVVWETVDERSKAFSFPSSNRSDPFSIVWQEQGSKLLGYLFCFYCGILELRVQCCFNGFK